MGTMLLLLLAAAALASVAALERLSGLPVESTFSFTLGGVPSAALLPKWQKSVTTYPLRGGGNRTRTRTIYFQPGAAPAGVSPTGCSQRSTAAVCDSFGVQLIVDAVSYPIRGGHTGTEWSLEFRNTGANATRPLCGVRTLDAALAMAHGANVTVSTHGAGPFAPPARVIGGDGSGCAGNGCQGKLNGDGRFCPTLASFPAGASKALASGGRSSDSGLGFWSAFITTGSGSGTTFSGVTASIGWSGYWKASLNRTSTSLQLQAGQGEFCAPIPPGDAFTFPRVLVVEWEGDSPQVGANAHRRVVVDYKIGRNPRSNEPVGMTSESNGCSWRCGGADSWKVFNLTTQLWHLKALQLTGVEGLWMDASWFKGDFGPNGNCKNPFPPLHSFPLTRISILAHTKQKQRPPASFLLCLQHSTAGL